MCVIAIKNIGKNLPPIENINAMWNANKDGAGFMYAIDGKVHIEKGFMKLSDLVLALDNLAKQVDITTIPLVLHFRIATHGKTSAENTHPFPISSKEDHLKALDLTCPLAVAHNGIISNITMPTDSTMSDTMVYISDILAPLSMLNRNFYANGFGKTLMENQIGWSKLAFLDKDGNIHTIGDFKNGTKTGTTDILYSNLSHEIDARFTHDISVNRYAPMGTTDLLDIDKVYAKPIPKGYYIGTYFKDDDNKIIMVKNDNEMYTNMDGIIYTADTFGVYSESDTYYGVFTTNEQGEFVSVSYDKMPTAEVVLETDDDIDDEVYNSVKYYGHEND